MPDRRAALFGGAALFAAAALPGRARAAAPATAAVLVPGPEDGTLARQLRTIGAVLAQALPNPEGLTFTVLGGPDGVTAANRFAAEAAPDGRSMLLLPGAAGQAWLVGDPRAKFNPAGWLPVCAAERTGIVVGRGPMPAAGARPRLALPGAGDPETAALLALDLAGVAAQPVLGLDEAAAGAACGRGEVDAYVVRGSAGLRRAAELGSQPWLRLDSGATVRPDPALASLPALHEVAAAAPRDMLAACQAAAAALGLHAALLLPALTPGDVVAFWRRAAARWVEQEGRGITTAQVLDGTEAADSLLPLAPSAVVTLAYREWLLRRLNWRAG